MVSSIPRQRLVPEQELPGPRRPEQGRPEQGRPTPGSHEPGFPEQGRHEPGFAGRGKADAYDGIDLAEASRQLELAAHDIAVAATCVGLGDLDEAHTNVITARAAADAAEEILRVVLGDGLGSSR